MAFINRFQVRNKFLFFTGALIFFSAAFYSNAKNDNNNLFLFIEIFGGILMCLGFIKPKEKSDN